MPSEEEILDGCCSQLDPLAMGLSQFTDLIEEKYPLSNQIYSRKIKHSNSRWCKFAAFKAELLAVCDQVAEQKQLQKEQSKYVNVSMYFYRHSNQDGELTNDVYFEAMATGSVESAQQYFAHFCRYHRRTIKFIWLYEDIPCSAAMRQALKEWRETGKIATNIDGREPVLFHQSLQ